MDFVTRRPNGVAARLWAAASESGIGPHDPLAPFIDAMADAAEGIETVGQEIKGAAATITTAHPTFTDDNLCTLAHLLRPDMHRLARAVQIKALVTAACTAVALLVGAFAAGYFFHDDRQLVAGVSAGQQECHDQPNGGTICFIPVWSKLPPTSGR